MSKQNDSVPSALVHPLVVMNISEHWTRVRVQTGVPQPVYGILMGKQIGRNVEIVNSFELKVMPGAHGLVLIDEEFFTQREALYKEVFSSLETIGWYTTGNHEKSEESDEGFHRQIMVRLEAPIMLKLNTETPTVADKLSIGAFESIVDPSNESALIFIPLNLKIISEHSEQIGIDHVARITNSGDMTQSSASKQLNAQLGALNMLIQRMETIVTYLKAVMSGNLPRNETVLIEAFKLCQKLNKLKLETLESMDEEEQELDHKLVVLLSAMTCIHGSMAQLISKLNVLATERYSSASSSLTAQSSRKFPFGLLSRAFL